MALKQTASRTELIVNAYVVFAEDVFVLRLRCTLLHKLHSVQTSSALRNRVASAPFHSRGIFRSHKSDSDIEFRL